MKWSSIILIAVIVGIVGLGAWQLNRSQNKEEVIEVEPIPTLTQEEVLGVKDQLEQITAYQLPTDADQTALRDISGTNSSGVATRKFINQKFEHFILADLPEPQTNTTYQAWLVRGQPGRPEFDLISTGRLEPRKGGWVLDFTSNLDLTDHNGIVVTVETNPNDQTPEIHILEGSF